MSIEITVEGMEQAEKILANVPKGAERAAASALNRGLSRVKTGAIKKVKEVYTVQSSALSAATKTRINKASAGNLVGEITFSGAKIPLYKFHAAPKAPGTKQLVNAGVMKGGGETFYHAFIAQMKSGHVGIFEREGKSRYPIDEIMGLAAAQMVKNEKVIEPLEEEAQKLVNERLEHEIERLLGGY